jgi:formamidopyrimidine-DNA glycosylase
LCQEAAVFELPECVTLARQMNETILGKVVQGGRLGNSPHKFVWYNRQPEEFTKLTRGKRVGKATAKGRWLFVPLEPGYVLVLGECGGRILFHPPGAVPPKRDHLFVAFDDGSVLSVMTQMWGAMELYRKGEQLKRKYIRDMRPTPIDPAFTLDYFSGLIDEVLQGEKRSAKGLLTQDQLIPGLGNALAQDILYRARLHPRRPLSELTKSDRRRLHRAITGVVSAAIRKGGRNDEHDLHDRAGGYVRLMDRDAVGKPCPKCGEPIEMIQYLGGACYFCPHCQT